MNEKKNRNYVSDNEELNQNVLQTNLNINKEITHHFRCMAPPAGKTALIHILVSFYRCFLDATPVLSSVLYSVWKKCRRTFKMKLLRKCRTNKQKHYPRTKLTIYKTKMIFTLGLTAVAKAPLAQHSARFANGPCVISPSPFVGKLHLSLFILSLKTTFLSLYIYTTEENKVFPILLWQWYRKHNNDDEHEKIVFLLRHTSDHQHHTRIQLLVILVLQLMTKVNSVPARRSSIATKRQRWRWRWGCSFAPPTWNWTAVNSTHSLDPLTHSTFHTHTQNDVRVWGERCSLSPI